MSHDVGYYADLDAGCQVFHVCSKMPDGAYIQSSFLCPNGTIFQQESFSCQWSVSSSFYIEFKTSKRKKKRERKKTYLAHKFGVLINTTKQCVILFNHLLFDNLGGLTLNALRAQTFIN